jgi:hypothetical protein
LYLPIGPDLGLTHVHLFKGWTTVTLEHAHPLQLFTYPVSGSGSDQHVHWFQGITRYSLEGDKMHFHRYLSRTGPAIALPGGLHYHELNTVVKDEPFTHQGNYYKTVLTMERHTHTIIGPTSLPIEPEPRKW